MSPTLLDAVSQVEIASETVLALKDKVLADLAAVDAAYAAAHDAQHVADDKLAEAQAADSQLLADMALLAAAIEPTPSPAG